MFNTANFAAITGRLVRDPESLRTADGSRLVRAVIAVQNNFKSRQDQKRRCQFITVEHPMPGGEGVNPWGDTCKGAKVQILGHIRPCEQKKGSKIGYGCIMVVADNMTCLETRAEIAARRTVQAAADRAAVPGCVPCAV